MWLSVVVRYLIVGLGAVLVLTGILNWGLAGYRIASTAGDDIDQIQFGRDLRGSMVAGQFAGDRDGASMYDPTDPAYTDVWAANFFYPPWFAIGMILIAWIDFQVLFLMWGFASLAALILAVRYLAPPAAGAVGIGVFLSTASLASIWFGQTAHFMLVILAASMVAALSGRKAAAGVGFGLLMFKPHLFVGVGLAWLTSFRRWRAAIGAMLGTTVVLFVVSWWWMPDAWPAFFRRLLETEPLAGAEREVSLLAGAQLAVGLTEPLGTIVGLALMGVVAGSVVALVLRYREDETIVLSVSIVASLLMAWHSLAYDWLLLVPAFAVLVVRGRIPARDAMLIGLILVAALPIGFLLTDLQQAFGDFAIHVPTWTLVAVYLWLVRRAFSGRLSGVAA